jgi:membrane protease YdiL (CAAX protease family)
MAALSGYAKLGAGRRLPALIDLLIWAASFAGVQLILQTIGARWVEGPVGKLLASPIQMLVLVVVSSLLIWRQGETWRSIGFSRRVLARRVAVLVIGGYVAALVCNAVVVLLAAPHLHVAAPKFSALGPLKGDLRAYLSWLAVALTSAALGEESQFRGFLWSRLEQLFGGGRGGVAFAMIGQAALFGLGHVYQGLSGVLTTGLLGLVLGTVFLLGRRNLAPCMILHGLIDTVSLTVLFFVAVPTLPVR